MWQVYNIISRLLIKILIYVLYIYTVYTLTKFKYIYRRVS